MYQAPPPVRTIHQKTETTQPILPTMVTDAVPMQVAIMNESNGTTKDVTSTTECHGETISMAVTTSTTAIIDTNAATIAAAAATTALSTVSKHTIQPKPRTRREKIKFEQEEKRRSKRANCKEPGPITPKKRKHVDVIKFPRVSQIRVLRLLQEDFGLEFLNNNTNNNEINLHRPSGACRLQGKEYPSVEKMRDDLCHNGLMAPNEDWFYENMTMPDKADWYLPSSVKAKAIVHWIRLAVVPVLCLKATVEIMQPVEVKKILAKIGIKCDMGYYTMDGQQLRWGAVERRLATKGFSDTLWNHSGATTDEKLSVMLYGLDYKTM